MRYDDPQLQDLLAGEYALGALHGAARARFESLLKHDPRLRRRVVQWQERLAPLAQETPEIAPPARVRAELRRRIRRGAAPVRWWNRLEFWRPFGAVAATLVVALAAYLAVQLTQPPATVALDPRYVAVLTGDDARPAVAVTAFVKPFRLTVEPLQALAVQPGNVLRIWAVDRDTGARRPLAQFQPGAPQRIALSEAEWQLVKTAATLEVREEPLQLAAAGPVGPVLYAGPCINLKGPNAS